MSANSKIEWTDDTFNPWIGRPKVSPACDHCYAERGTPSRTLGVAILVRAEIMPASLEGERWQRNLWVFPKLGDRLFNVLQSPSRIGRGVRGFRAPEAIVTRVSKAIDECLVHPDTYVDRNGQAPNATDEVKGLKVSASQCFQLVTRQLEEIEVRPPHEFPLRITEQLRCRTNPSYRFLCKGSDCGDRVVSPYQAAVLDFYGLSACAAHLQGRQEERSDDGTYRSDRLHPSSPVRGFQVQQHTERDQRAQGHTDSGRHRNTLPHLHLHCLEFAV
ncbi:MULTISPECIES: DUF5131 family protein [unclassified Variovorax]|uniref:DUF5131 family protein n=1 Tax=unclassified Variovorax TaxID=663243 RepID=UPI0018D76318|nr:MULTISPECIES: DUF5131 family protein [unclassified Variovorax]